MQNFLFSYSKTTSVAWSSQGLSLGPPAQQTSAFPTELTRRRYTQNTFFFLPKTHDEQLNSDKCGLAMGVFV